MALHKKPRVVLNFKTYETETEKAYLFTDYKDKQIWIPKSIGKILSIKNHIVKVLIAPFKYEELTGNEIQLLDTDIKWRKPEVKESPIEVIENERFKLLPAQKEACNFILSLKKSALFAETRTGKTFISLIAAKSRQEAGLIDNVIVFTRVRLIEQWQKFCNIFEIKNFHVFGIEHLSNEFTHENVEFELLAKVKDKSQMIIDESHLFKNHDCERTKRLVSTIGEIDCFKIIMTGTPVGKHLGDLYTQFELLDKQILNYSNYRQFEAVHLLYGGSNGKKVVGYVNIEEFAYSLEPYIYRLKRAEVLRDRPVNYETIYFEMTYDERQRYIEELAKLKEFEEKGLSFNILGELVNLQMLVSTSVNRLKELERFKGKRPIIFYKYDVEADFIKTVFDFPILCGKTKKKDFLRFVDDYNDGKIAGLIVNQSLATGFDLGTAETVIFYSSVFDMIQKTQAADRVMNMFNEKPVEIIEICCHDSIDEQIANVLNRKINIKTAFYRELARLNNKELQNDEKN